jgi:hypothetical protein
LPDDGKIVADKQDCQSGLAFEVSEQPYDLLLNGYVQSTDWLVANQQPRLQHHRSCYADSLALAAAEFMRITGCQRRVEPDACQRL